MSDYDRLDPHDPHADVAAYLLAALDDAEMDRFERHLATCGTCSARLDELSGLVPVLTEAKGAGVPEPPSRAMLDRLLGEVAAERRAKRRRRVLVGVAASVLIAAGPTAAVLGTQASAPPYAVQGQPGTQHSATDPSSGVHATVRLAAQKWGTHVDLMLTHVYGPLTCHLVALGRSGQQETVANWTVPATGYGTDDQPVPLNIQGSTAMPSSDITRFDVITSAGQHLVSVPV